MPCPARWLRARPLQRPPLSDFVVPRRNLSRSGREPLSSPFVAASSARHLCFRFVVAGLQTRSFSADSPTPRFCTSKYGVLETTDVRNSQWNALDPKPPLYLFVPRNESLYEEYEKGWRIPDIYNQNGDPAPGVVTTQDEFAISFSREEAKQKVLRLLATETEAEARGIFRLCTQSQWSYDTAKTELPRTNWEKRIIPILYRPFDLRWTVFDSNVAVHRRERVMKHMLAGPSSGRNLALATTRTVEIGRGFEHIFCSRHVIQHHTVSLKEVNYLFPVHLYDEAKSKHRDMFASESTRSNLNPRFAEAMEAKAGISIVAAESGNQATTLGTEDVTAYLYAILHSMSYRNRNDQFLKLDFPRVPLTSDRTLLLRLVEKGHALIALHLMESPKVNTFITRYEQPGDHIVEKVRYVEPNPKAGIKSGRVHINSKQYFEGVPKEVWEFHIGGYQVCEKWLKDRKGRTLSSDDIDHYQKIVVALSETIRIMREIDEIIPGWPLP